MTIYQIRQDKFLSIQTLVVEMGEDLDCCQLAAKIDGVCYVAVDDEQEDEINIDIDCL